MSPDVHALAGAYALDALPPDEATQFAEHVAECAACAQEVAELQITAGQLGLAVTETPPADLRDRVLRAVHQTRQVPPITAPTDLATRRRMWPRLVAAAAAVVILVGGGLLAVRPLLDDAGAPTRQERIAAVMDAPDAHSSTARVQGGGTLTVVSSHQLDRAVVLSENLPPLDEDKVYQLWLVDPSGSARSADVLIEASGFKAMSTDLVKGLQPGDSIAITREPAGGSEQPTMTPLAAVQRV